MGRLYDFPFLQECTAPPSRLSGQRQIGAGASRYFRRASGAFPTFSAYSHRSRGVLKTFNHGLLLIIAAIVLYTVLPMCSFYTYYFILVLYSRFPQSLLVYFKFRHRYASGRHPPLRSLSGDPTKYVFVLFWVCPLVWTTCPFAYQPPFFPPFLLFPYIRFGNCRLSVNIIHPSSPSISLRICANVLMTGTTPLQLYGVPPAPVILNKLLPR